MIIISLYHFGSQSFLLACAAQRRSQQCSQTKSNSHVPILVSVSAVIAGNCRQNRSTNSNKEHYFLCLPQPHNRTNCAKSIVLLSVSPNPTRRGWMVNSTFRGTPFQQSLLAQCVRRLLRVPKNAGSTLAWSGDFLFFLENEIRTTSSLRPMDKKQSLHSVLSMESILDQKNSLSPLQNSPVQLSRDKIFCPPRQNSSQLIHC